jgi:HD-GYP domain-containing protein (c-di-GMP phosphodiesterase class II)
MSAKDNSERDAVEQIFIIKNAATDALESLYQNGANYASIEKCLDISKNIMGLVKDLRFVDSIKHFKDYTSPLHTHSFLVSLFSVMTCHRLQWNTDRTLNAVALGGLLQNIGLTKLPENLRVLDPRDLTPEDQRRYQRHPEMGMNLLGSFPQIPAAVLQIVLQHHELNGRGYPLELPLSKIYPLARVICLADRFATLVIMKDMLFVDGLQRFIMNRSEILQHDPDLVRAFIKGFIKDEKKI